MAVLRAPKLSGRTGSMSDRRLKRHSSDGSRCACGSILRAILLASIVMIPYILVGPNVVFSVNISPREEYGNGARSGVRALSRDRADDTEESLWVPAGRTDNLSSAGGELQNPAEGDGGVSAASGAGDLCLSMAIGISSAQLVTFAASFREVAPAARLVMFFEAPTSDRFNDVVDKFGIIPLQVDRNRLEPAFLRRFHPSSVRWVLIQRFLDIKASDYERVLMADAGQTFFQGNPFDIIGDPGLYTFMDDHVIGYNQEHSTQIQNCLGSSVLAKLADKPAIHSAVSLGTSSFATEHARQMSQGIVSPVFQACEAAGVAAGLQDYLLHSEDAQGLLKFDQASGPVADVQTGKYDISDSRVVNLSGRVVPIVYRYVGNAALKADVFRRYIYWTEGEMAEEVPSKVPTAGVRNTATVASPITVLEEKKIDPPASPSTIANCEQYSLSEGFDLFRAICDLSNTRTRTIGGCCTACNGHQACQAFSFDKSNGMCYMKNCDTAKAPGPSTTIRSITSGMKSRQMAE